MSWTSFDNCVYSCNQLKKDISIHSMWWIMGKHLQVGLWVAFLLFEFLMIDNVELSIVHYKLSYFLLPHLFQITAALTTLTEKNKNGSLLSYKKFIIFLNFLNLVFFFIYISAVLRWVLNPKFCSFWLLVWKWWFLMIAYIPGRS